MNGQILQNNFNCSSPFTRPNLASLFIGWWMIIALKGWLKKLHCYCPGMRHDVIGVMKLHDLTGWLKLFWRSRDINCIGTNELPVF
jgi:hypothetical protein